ncbi:alternative ribosome rescue aminoacyl-tRNA hydrolase ArfB [Pedobacter sp. MW01-1-1]|uniref:alternative ribosome rescue aminoacyl-tRNA hydrolase ArfB n=1 Tax=Pedobacter sp. MW01-1-1 TaxID=3383027 RepID=UPI003FEE9BDE
MIPGRDELVKFLIFKTSRSGGKGGQNVNKVSSKVELVFAIDTAHFLADDEKELLKSRLQNRLDNEGLLHITAQEERSQLLNKEKAIAKLMQLIKQNLVVQKKRKPSKIPKAIIEKRLKNKAATAEKKKNRKFSGYGF